MFINNALLDGEVKNIVISGGIITEITDRIVPDGINARGKKVIPGLIDVHTHGCVGMDTMDADFRDMVHFYAKNGTTSLLATTMTMDYDSLLRVCNAKTDFGGANILGFHFEGPFISSEFKGAQNEKYIRPASLSDFRKFKNVKMITVAPETKNCIDFIKAVSNECVVSLGHTGCDYDTAINAINNGALCLTHMYNAMPPLHHRNPGPIGAAIEKNIYTQLICDGIHISKPAVISSYKTFGADRLVLISDSIRSAGLDDGEYESGGLKIFLKDGVATLSDGTIAGSSATLWDCVKKAVEFGIPFDDAVKMASQTPAEMLKINKGKVAVGYDADLLIVNDEMNLESVIISGKIYK